MKIYLLRALKYVLTFTAIWMALIWLKVTYEHLPVTFGQMLSIYFTTWNGWAMAAMVLALGFTYPFFGFVTRSVDADVVADREQIEAAMATVGLVISGCAPDRLIFRATGLQRLTLLFEDEVVVQRCGEQVTICGHRRTVVRAIIRLEGYLSHKRRVNE